MRRGVLAALAGAAVLACAGSASAAVYTINVSQAPGDFVPGSQFQSGVVNFAPIVLTPGDSLNFSFTFGGPLPTPPGVVYDGVFGLASSTSPDGSLRLAGDAGFYEVFAGPTPIITYDTHVEPTGAPAGVGAHTITVDSFSFVAGPVPEPATWSLLGLSVALMGAAFRCRRQCGQGLLA